MTIEARVSLAHVLSTPVVLTPHDAVAVIVQLAQSPQTGRPLPIRLEPSHVWLECDGSVTLSPGLLPPLGDVAALLDRLLHLSHRDAPERIPRGLLSIVERASGHHDATSIPSLSAFAAALAPFQPPDPAAAIRLLIASADEWSSVPPPAAPLPVDPQPDTPSTVDPIAGDTPSWRPSRWQMAGAAAAILFAAGIGIGAARVWDGVPALPAAEAASPTVAVHAATPERTPEPPASDVPGASVPSPPATPPPSKTGGPSGTVEARPVRLIDRHAVPAKAVFSPSFAPNGSAVLFHAEVDDGTALERAEADDRGELRVATIIDDGARNYHVRLSPDGRLVAFDSDRDGERGVYVAGADGHEVRRVSGPGYAAVPSWSPDGRRLAFIRAESDRPSVWNLWLLDRDSGQQLRVTAFRRGQVWSGAWFADGQRIVYSHEDRLLIHDLATSRARDIASPIAGRQVRTPAVSPDGRWIMFQVFRDGAWLFDVENGAMRRVLDDASAEEFAWSPDGRRVAYHSQRSGGWNLWTMAPP